MERSEDGRTKRIGHVCGKGVRGGGTRHLQELDSKNPKSILPDMRSAKFYNTRRLSTNEIFFEIVREIFLESVIIKQREPDYEESFLARFMNFCE